MYTYVGNISYLRVFLITVPLPININKSMSSNEKCPIEVVKPKISHYLFKYFFMLLN